MCQTVYEKDGKLFAKTSVEVVRVRGNTMTFRPLHLDGTKGDSRSVTLDPSWRATNRWSPVSRQRPDAWAES